MRTALRTAVLTVFMLLVAIAARAQDIQQWETIGAFYLITATDEITDDMGHVVANIGNSVDDGIGVGVACDPSGRLKLIITTPYLVGSNNRVGVYYRFDKKLAVGRLLMLGSSHKVVSTYEEAPSFVEEGRGASRLVIRVVDLFDGEEFTETFDWSRFDEAITKLNCLR